MRVWTVWLNSVFCKNLYFKVHFQSLIHRGWSTGLTCGRHFDLPLLRSRWSDIAAPSFILESRRPPHLISKSKVWFWKCGLQRLQVVIHIPWRSCRLRWIKCRERCDVKLADNRIQRECSDGSMHESDPRMLNYQIILTGQNVHKTGLCV